MVKGKEELEDGDALVLAVEPSALRSTVYWAGPPRKINLTLCAVGLVPVRFSREGRAKEQRGRARRRAVASNCIVISGMGAFDDGWRDCIDDGLEFLGFMGDFILLPPPPFRTNTRLKTARILPQPAGPQWYQRVEPFPRLGASHFPQHKVLHHRHHIHVTSVKSW